VASAVGLATGVADDGIGTGDAEGVEVAAVGLATGDAVDGAGAR
jgi:hypothetical protein